jgi:hypothetical protein
MGSTFALCMIIVVLLMVFGTLLIRKHPVEPVIPLHEDNDHSLNLPFYRPPATLTNS